MSLTTVAETYANCLGYSVTIGTVSGDATEGNYKIEAMVDDMTSLGDSGGYADVKTIRKVTGTLTVAWKTSSSSDLAAGSIYALIIDGGVGNPYLSCNVRITDGTYPVMDPRKGLKVPFSFTSQGSINTTRPG